VCDGRCPFLQQGWQNANARAERALSLLPGLRVVGRPGQTSSILGYCLLPMVLLAVVSAVLATTGHLMFLLTVAAVGWCTWRSSEMMVLAMDVQHERALGAPSLLSPPSLSYTFCTLSDNYPTPQLPHLPPAYLSLFLALSWLMQTFWAVAYPIGLFYACFALISVF
jgi:hypothetical protein